MPSKNDDPTEPLRAKACRYPEVDEGTACTQSSFKTGKKAFLFVGMQGGRYKAMFKLRESMKEASKLAADDPDSYQVGSTGWVTARFTADRPLPRRVWEAWLDESYALSAGNGPAAKRASAKSATRTKKKAPTAKSVSASQKAPAVRKATKTRATRRS